MSILVMKLPLGIRVVGGLALLAALVYLTNPFRTDTLDPRIRIYGVTIFRMPSRSMEPTLHENSIFLVSAWPYLGSEPRPGDLVVFKYPLDPTVAYVKRIIASGGSTVEISNGVVRVDGRPLAEEYLDKERAVTEASTGMPRRRVPPKAYFVMGDNRDNSQDSRIWGFLPRDHIIGEVVVVLK
jgi:signal peptidase I